MAGRSPFSDPLQGQGSAGDSGGDSDSDISGVVDDATTYRRITGPTSTATTIAAAPTTTATLHASAGAGVGAGAGSSATVARSDPKAAVATSTTAAAAAATTQSAASTAFTGVDVTQQPPAISAAYLAVLASTRCSVTAPSIAELVALLQKATQTAGVDVARTADWQVPTKLKLVCVCCDGVGLAPPLTSILPTLMCVLLPVGVLEHQLLVCAVSVCGTYEAHIHRGSSTATGLRFGSCCCCCSLPRHQVLTAHANVLLFVLCVFRVAV